MKTPLSLNIFGLAFLAIFFAACGGGNGSSPNDPTLGITSIQNMGATAIPNDTVSSGKITLAKSFSRGMDFLFGQRSAHALTAPCPGNSPVSFDIPGGKICVDEVFMILDKVQFNISTKSPDSPDDLELGPFGLDLLNTEDAVDQAIDIGVPPGKYNNVRFQVRRIDDTRPATNMVPPLLIATMLSPDSSEKRRPSVWIKGCVDDGTMPSTCRVFKFVTDKRWEETILFDAFSGDIVNAVLELNLEEAFNAALNALEMNATQLQDEIGLPGENFMGPDFLDGRVKDPDHGTPIAEMIAEQLPLHFRVLIQSTDVVNFEDFPDGTSLIDDSATVVSEPVKPEHIEDITADEPET